MKLIVTINEILEHIGWKKYCEKTGTSIYAIKEGLIDTDKEVELPEEFNEEFLASLKKYQEM